MKVLSATLKKIVDSLFSEIGKTIARYVMPAAVLAASLFFKTVRLFVVNTLWPFLFHYGSWVLLGLVSALAIVLLLRLVGRFRDVSWLRKHSQRLRYDFRFLFWFPINNAYAVNVVGVTPRERGVILHSKTVNDLLMAGVINENRYLKSQYEISPRVYDYLEHFLYSMDNDRRKQIEQECTHDAFARALLVCITNNPDYEMDRAVF